MVVVGNAQEAKGLPHCQISFLETGRDSDGNLTLRVLYSSSCSHYWLILETR